MKPENKLRLKYLPDSGKGHLKGFGRYWLGVVDKDGHLAGGKQVFPSDDELKDMLMAVVPGAELKVDQRNDGYCTIFISSGIPKMKRDKFSLQVQRKMR